MTVLNHAELVGNEVLTRVATLTTAQGAETDIGTKTYRGVRRVNKDMLPCTVLVEGDDYPVKNHQVGTQYRIQQRYALLAYLACDPLNPNVAAHAAIRDMQRAVFRSSGAQLKARFNDTVQSVTYLGRDIAPRSDGEDFVVAAIEFEVAYVMDIANP